MANNNLVCTYTIANGGHGGRLTGGFPAANPPSTDPPSLAKSQSLQVVVLWTGPTPPKNGQMTGYLVFSPAAQADNQAAPSPFMHGHNFLCFQKQTPVRSVSGSDLTFTFPALPYNGSAPGKYELTFIAQEGDGNDPHARQWSADPEFDTGS
jgi:hypothetical protein